MNITAAREGWQSVTLKGVQIFGGQTTLAPLELAPIGLGRMSSDPMLVEIPPHPLFSGQGGSGVAPATADLDRILTQVVIPKTITVHLGAPSASASNVTVSFVTYIATVASGEIYPTWPEPGPAGQYSGPDQPGPQPDLHRMVPEQGLQL